MSHAAIDNLNSDSVGQYRFGKTARNIISNTGTDGYEILDAVQLVRVD